MNVFRPIAISLTLASTMTLAAQAQSQAPTQETTTTTTVTTYRDGRCGAWQGDTWVPNGTCTGDQSAYRHERMAGTIIAVKGHLVTVQQTDKTVVINDQPALDNHMTGKVAVGREVVAHGYWQGDTFYATALTPAMHENAM